MNPVRYVTIKIEDVLISSLSERPHSGSPFTSAGLNLHGPLPSETASEGDQAGGDSAGWDIRANHD